MSPAPEAICVVIPLYNQADYVGRALDSVLAQTRSPDDVVVVDDGSTDCGPDIARRYARRGVRCLRQPNAGPSAARNLGLAESDCPRVAFLDADDEWRPDFLARLGRFLDEHPQVALVGAACLDGATQRPLVPHKAALPDRAVQGIVPAYFRTMLRGFFINASSALLRRSACGAVGGFDESVRYGEDPDFLGRIALRSPVGYVADPLAVYHTEALGRAGERFEQRPYPPFVATARRAIADGRVAPHCVDDLRDFCFKLLLGHVAYLHRIGDDHGARKLLYTCTPKSPHVRAELRHLQRSLARLRGLRRALRATLREMGAPGRGPAPRRAGGEPAGPA
jgi:glycosyltransferase involved in cell wall biosynthesis